METDKRQGDGERKHDVRTGDTVLDAVGVSPTFTRSTDTTQYGFLRVRQLEKRGERKAEARSAKRISKGK